MHTSQTPCLGAHPHHPSQTSLLMHIPESFPNTPPGAHCSVLPKIPSRCTSQQPSPTFFLVHIPVSFSNNPPGTHPYIPASLTKEGCNPWCTSAVLGWGQAKAPFEVSWQVPSLELSQPKSSSIETKTHSWGLTLVGSCSNHRNDSSLGFLFLLHLQWNF